VAWLKNVEHGELLLDFRHARANDLMLELISPDGTHSHSLLIDRSVLNWFPQKP
jgi:hypothetical protein